MNIQSVPPWSFNFPRTLFLFRGKGLYGHVSNDSGIRYSLPQNAFRSSIVRNQIFTHHVLRYGGAVGSELLLSSGSPTFALSPELEFSINSPFLDFYNFVVFETLSAHATSPSVPRRVCLVRVPFFLFRAGFNIFMISRDEHRASFAPPVRTLNLIPMQPARTMGDWRPSRVFFRAGDLTEEITLSPRSSRYFLASLVGTTRSITEVLLCLYTFDPVA